MAKEPPSPSPQDPVASNKRWLIRQISLFKNLSEEQLDFTAERSRLVELEKGEPVYRQGDPPHAFFGLVSGRVRVFAQRGEGQPETLELLHRGDYFGMMSLLTNEPHSVTTVTLNDSILLRIDRTGFEEILKEIPEVAIHLSTTLSKRLRQKDIPSKQVFESTLISIYSAPGGSGRTLYAINLAASLKRETGKNVILLDVSPGGDAVCRALGIAASPTPLRLGRGGFDQAEVSAAFLKHPAAGFDILSIAHTRDAASDVTQITPLLSYLANLYHFVISDLPHFMDRTVFKALAQADLIHLVCEGSRDPLEATAQVVEDLTRTIQQAAQRVRVVVNETAGSVPERDRRKILKTKVYATLPAVGEPPAPGHPVVLVHPDWEYSRAVRRVSREIGKMLVGLVLGSGAAMGLSHIGVIRVLEREGIPIDIVAGSSIGALIGAFWASCMNAEQMVRVADAFRTKHSLIKLVDPVIPKFGMLGGGQITRFLARHLGNKTFRDLKTPMKIVAVDYLRREVVVLDEGSLVQAIRASVSIPAIFVPIRVRGRYLIDGGILDPVPVDILSQMGVRKIIAVNTLPSPADIHRRYQEFNQERERLAQEAKMLGWKGRLGFWFRRRWWNWVDTNLFDLIMHTIQGMEYVLAESQCAQADVVLHPTIPRINWWEFYSVNQLIERGEEEALTHLAEIKRLVSE